jgi:hypothetical protein
MIDGALVALRGEAAGEAGRMRGNARSATAARPIALSSHFKSVKSSRFARRPVLRHASHGAFPRQGGRGAEA